MTEEKRRPTITVSYDGRDSAALRVVIDPDVSIGQLQLAAAELTELTREARAGQRAQAAQARLETLSLAQQIQRGVRQ